jgi:hypothetical protein
MNYIFNTEANSYFNGQDIRIENTTTHEVILVNVKDGMWAVNVKDDTSFNDHPADVQNAITVLPDAVVEGIEQQIKQDWWEGANVVADEHGFAHIYSAGRSEGWAAVDGTQSWEPSDLFTLRNDVPDFLAVAFHIAGPHMTNAIETAQRRLREAMQELQLELLDYADWVGAEVQTLDGKVFKVAKLTAVNGRAALHTGRSGFAFATEAKLVRKADGQVPARLTADPIMEQVFQIIEARGALSKGEIDTFLDADDDHDPIALYQDEIVRGINAVEMQIEAWCAASGDA